MNWTRQEIQQQKNSNRIDMCMRWGEVVGMQASSNLSVSRRCSLLCLLQNELFMQWCGWWVAFLSLLIACGEKNPFVAHKNARKWSWTVQWQVHCCHSRWMLCRTMLDERILFLLFSSRFRSRSCFGLKSGKVIFRQFYRQSMQHVKSNRSIVLETLSY